MVEKDITQAGKVQGDHHPRSITARQWCVDVWLHPACIHATKLEPQIRSVS